MAAALVHGLASRGEGTLLDIAQRVRQWREVRAHERAWCAAEADLIDGPDTAEAEPVVVERPRPFPEGPADRYARRALAAGAAAVVVGATPFPGPRRAAALGVASLPKGPSVGRSAFAAQLGRVPATRNALVMERSVLRRLDAVDVLVLDETAFGSGRWVLSDLVPLPDAGPVNSGPQGTGGLDRSVLAATLGSARSAGASPWPAPPPRTCSAWR